ncbi:hypothetical protein K504DRAFT_454944 [Pleomassaria siparia CBS 279.74]|uniref:Mid2 domain-containing protein n=1 Tax=Pleomassaria siparia CBS 279.74 TaxID=1314801 RepID=A0A6G1K9Q9_9PLEO|nr:hypothetical protein K504DRAFT_454944 [Pleomassaria siparia CBS 279.74]
MLSTMRQSWLLFALFALMGLASALSLENLHIDGIEEYLYHGKRQQASGTGGNTASATATPTPTPTPTPTSTQEESSIAPSSSVATSENKASSTPPPAASSAASSSAVPVSSPAPTSAPQTSKADSSKSTVTTPILHTSNLVSTSIERLTSSYLTIVNGQTQLTTDVSTKTDLITTGQTVSTELPQTQTGSGGSGGGLSSEKKSIIGGVVGGVGGALLLGGLALVAWRIWGRKNRVSADDDDLTFSTGSALGDKSSPGATNNTPFQTNLEQYHNPGGRPNAAANF